MEESEEVQAISSITAEEQRAKVDQFHADLEAATSADLPEIEDTIEPAAEPDALSGVTEEQIALIIQKYEAHKAAEANKSADDEDPAIVGRELMMVPDKRYGMIQFRRKGGGRIPTILQGSWFQAEAERSLELYKKGALKPSPIQVVNTHATKN